MEIRFVLVFILFPFLLYSQTEEQRKYKFKDPYFMEFISEDSVLGNFRFYKHSVYEYRDIYFDTPENEMTANGLSLRIRKRLISEDSAQYLMQLKSEMSDSSAIRMEVEEEDLSLYAVFIENQKIPLITVIDMVLTIYDSSGVITRDQRVAMNHLQTWFSQKKYGVITPFQKINNLKKNIQIGRMEPVLIGHEYRARRHIYYENADTTAPDLYHPNLLKKSDTPEYFLRNENKIWLMESSSDLARFYDIQEKVHYQIREFEIENKYYDQQVGTKAMDDLEQNIKDRFSFRKEYLSKFAQCRGE